MDPNANLRQQEEILSGTPAEQRADRDELRELREELRTWLDRGGFEPDWNIAPKARHYYRK